MDGIPQTYEGKRFRYAWCYIQDGRTLGIVARYDGQDGKHVVPFFKPNGQVWKPGGLPTPRPLYGLDTIRPGKTTFVSEGEKAAAALHSLGLPCVTSQGGSQAAAKADWKPLRNAGRVIILPDANEPGEGYARDVCKALSGLDKPPKIQLARLPGLPEGGDVVDFIQARYDGWDGFSPIDEADVETLREVVFAAVKKVLEAPPKEWFESVTHSTVTALSEWTEPCPLPSDGSEPERYPVEMLPERLRVAAQELEASAYVPVSAPGTVALGMLAAALRKAVIVQEKRGLRHFPTLFVVLVAGSGERKSPVFKALEQPVLEWQEAKRPGREAELARVAAHNAALDDLAAQTRRDAKKERLGVDVLARDLADIEAQRKKPPPAPRLWTSDTTPERLFQLMHDRDGAFAVMSGEGRTVVNNILGRYENGGTAESIFLEGISGDSISRDRIGPGDMPDERVIPHPALNVCCYLQPDKWAQLAKHPTMRGSGLLARIWPVGLPSLVGYRLESPDDAGLDETKLEPFFDVVRAALDVELGTEPHVIRLGTEAQEARRELHNAIEIEMRDGGAFADYRDVASKFTSQVVKLAGLFSVLENPDALKAEYSYVSLGTWDRAEVLGHWHLTEAKRMLGMAQGTDDARRARAVVDWLRQSGKETVTARQLQRQGPRPRPKGDEARDLLAWLCELGWLRLAPPERDQPGMVYRVHPKLSGK
ncbi:YfjI family protein [Methylohalobius crimeensis]|uniref:YfjI family protein n=1 Tax=Methylohalobius crimeensis TaxID=244365 RepID=UPI0003B6214D|nr:YfjI family protein [Methylohalobius crimeensis]